MGNDDDVDVDHVARIRYPGKIAGLVRFADGEVKDFAASEEPARLNLAT